MLRKTFYSKICLLSAAILLLIPVNTSAQDIIKLEAKLVSMPENLPGCGKFMVRAVMVYEVLQVLEGDYKGREIHVVHQCPEMSRKAYSADSGNVEKFAIGDSYTLWVQLLPQDKLDYSPRSCRGVKGKV
ncbi:hypothetical protein HY948_05135 [Candidatus Gottesmanbacteria bacterium]|nr:hypothetical protein [Candidatus Gottesmanbacteria bacterium]